MDFHKHKSATFDRKSRFWDLKFSHQVLTLFFVSTRRGGVPTWILVTRAEARSQLQAALKLERRKTKKEGDAMKLRPLHDRVIVKRIEEEEKTSGGIIIPDTAKEKPQEGKVIAVGKGKILDNGKVSPMAVEKGDRILFGKYSGTDIKID